MTRVTPKMICVRELASGIIGRTHATHGIDKYPAKMVPHLARYAIDETSVPGDIVLDPFCGCGTVLVEAIISGRDSIGFDVNPVAVLLARVKASVFETRRIRKLANEICSRSRSMKGTPRNHDPEWLDFWFTRRTLEKLRQLRYQIESYKDLSKRYRELFLVCLIICVRRCSLADPRSPKPFISRNSRANREGKHLDAFAIFPEVVENIIEAFDDLRAKLPAEPGVARAIAGDARYLTRRETGPVNTVVTSPPYLSAQDYYRSSKLELAVSGLWRHGLERTLGERIIGSGRGNVVANMANEKRALKIDVPPLSKRAKAVVQRYLLDMREVLRGIYSCLVHGGHCCMIIGDSMIEGETLPVHQWIATIAEETGLVLDRHEMDLIRDRRVPPKRIGHASVIDREHLLFFRKT